MDFAIIVLSLIFISITHSNGSHLLESHCNRLGREVHHCVLTPEQIEGPYFIDNQLVRSDVREDRKGVPLKLTFTLQNIHTCKPIIGVKVNIWSADARGVYSGFAAEQSTPTDKYRWLRGVQFSDKNGRVTFKTIFPGWYESRSVHIHLESHVKGRTVHKTQFYFDELLTQEVAATFPYTTDNTVRIKNVDDYYFNNQEGSKLLLNAQYVRYNVTSGLKAQVILGIDPRWKPLQNLS